MNNMSPINFNKNNIYDNSTEVLQPNSFQVLRIYLPTTYTISCLSQLFRAPNMDYAPSLGSMKS